MLPLGLFAILAALLVTPAAAQDKVIKIAGLAPTTGNVATFGVGQRNSYMLAVEEANKAGGLGEVRTENRSHVR